MSKKVFDFSTVDWSKSNKEIVKATGISYSAVLRQRRVLGLPIGKRGRPSIPLEPFVNLDWTKTDSVLATELNMSIQRINVIRHKLNKPTTRSSKNGNKSPETTVAQSSQGQSQAEIQNKEESVAVLA